jgi:YHS domain-containing protein
MLALSNHASFYGGAMSIDPVCGMEVEETSEFVSNEGGQTTYFCSAECKEKFERNPNEFTNAA